MTAPPTDLGAALGRRVPADAKIRRVWTERLPEGPESIDETVRRMQAITADAVFDTDGGREPGPGFPRLVVRRAAEQIVRRTPGGNRDAEARAVWAFVRRFVRFTRDPAFLEYLQDPRTLLAQIDENGLAFGDCDDHAMLSAALVLVLRIPAVFVLMGARANDEAGHVYAAIQGQSPVDPVQRSRWLAGDDSADPGLVSLDTAAPDAAFGKHPHGAWRKVVPAIV